MLKFLRKYQLIILVVGGSLLMVVFLLEPVISRLQPNPGKRTAAEIGLTGAKVSGNDLALAQSEVRAVGQFLPALLQANAVGIGLDTDEKNWDDHWLLLTREAERGGFIGGPSDGFTWMPELASMLAQQQADLEMQQRRFRSEAEYVARHTELEQALSMQFARAAQQIPAGMAMTEDQFGMALAKARGVRRMLNTYGRAPKPSRQQAVSMARDALDAVQFDFARIRADQYIDPDAQPTDEELGVFFDQYREAEPEDNKFGLSYILPPRITFTSLELSRPSIMASLIADRIELNKRWRADRETYPGEFNAEIANVDADWRLERANELMIEADQVIRAEVRRAMRPYAVEGGGFDVPEGTNPADFEAIAQVVADELRQRHNVIIPLPTVRVVTDRWQTADDLRIQRGLGQANYRLGNRQYPAFFLPELLDPDQTEVPFPGTVGVPVVDPSAEDQQGSRYYITALDWRPRSAAESIEEVGREKVIENWQTVRAYEKLLEREGEILEVARRTGGLTAVAELLDPQATDAGAAPRRINIVRGAQAMRDRMVSTFDPRLNTPEIRQAIRDAAATLDPMTDPRDLDREQSIMVLELPSALSLVAVEIVAPRPLTINDFRAMAPQMLPFETDNWLREDPDFADSFPFTYAALRDKYQYRVIASEDDEDAPAADPAS